MFQPQKCLKRIKVGICILTLDCVLKISQVWNQGKIESRDVILIKQGQLELGIYLSLTPRPNYSRVSNLGKNLFSLN